MVGARDIQPEALRRLQIEHELERARLLDGQIPGLGAAQDAVHVQGYPRETFARQRSIREKPTSKMLRCIRICCAADSVVRMTGAVAGLARFARIAIRAALGRISRINSSRLPLSSG